MPFSLQKLLATLAQDKAPKALESFIQQVIGTTWLEGVKVLGFGWSLVCFATRFHGGLRLKVRWAGDRRLRRITPLHARGAYVAVLLLQQVWREECHGTL